MARILFGLFCEDLRIEQSLQVTAVGIWGSEVQVPAFPAVLKSIAFFACVDNPELLAYPFTITVDLLDGAPRTFRDVIDTSEGRTAQTFNIVFGPVMIGRPGVVRATFILETTPPEVAVFELGVAQIDPRRIVPHRPGVG